MFKRCVGRMIVLVVVRARRVIQRTIQVLYSKAPFYDANATRTRRVETYAHPVDVSRVTIRGEHGRTDVCVCAVYVLVSPPCVCWVSWVRNLVVVPVAVEATVVWSQRNN